MPHDPSKPCLILDLDQTLISAEASEDLDFKDPEFQEKSKRFRSDNMEGYYVVYSRPHLQEFLDYIFENFNVCVWTAASKDYALFIIKNIILNNDSNRKLDYIFFSYHCDWSKRKKKYTKDLCMFWDIYKLPGYDQSNTVILDDYKNDVHKCQPNNCIIAPPFEFVKENSHKDTFLKDLIPELEKMKERVKNNNPELASPINTHFKTHT